MIPTTQSVAVTDEYCQEQSEIINKKCQYFNGTHYLPVAGCEYDEGQKKCVACPVGYYGADCSDQCISDGVLDSIKTLGISIESWGGSTGATTAEECSWWLNCPVTSEWGGADTGCQACDNGFVAYEHKIGYANGEIIDEENLNEKCKTCGAYSTPGTSTSDPSAGACFCNNGYHIENSSYNTTETNQPDKYPCVPATYRIRIYKNRPWVLEDPEYIDLYVQTGSDKLVQDTNTSDTTPADNGRDTWFDQQSAISNWPTLSDTPADDTTTYKLTTYNTVAGTIYARPGTPYKGTALTDDIDLYAQWSSIGTYTVQYGNTTGPDTTSDLIEIDIKEPHTVLNPFPCNLDTFTDEFYRGWNRQKFTGWKIYINDALSQTISIDTLQAGNITVQGAAGDTIYLEGQTEPCPAGYYCNPEQCYENEDKNKSFVYPCDEGYYCPESSATQEKCPAGYYCETQETKTECPAGSYCPQGSQKPKSCPTGLTSKAGAAAITECGITNTTTFTDNNDKSLQLPLGNGVIFPCKWCTEQSSSI